MTQYDSSVECTRGGEPGTEAGRSGRGQTEDKFGNMSILEFPFNSEGHMESLKDLFQAEDWHGQICIKGISLGQLCGKWPLMGQDGSQGG